MSRWVVVRHSEAAEDTWYHKQYETKESAWHGMCADVQKVIEGDGLEEEIKWVLTESGPVGYTGGTELRALVRDETAVLYAACDIVEWHMFHVS